jgi:hypothetical protein
MLAYHIEKHSGWFRVFGYGMRWSDRTVCRALFSERTGRKRVWRVGPWSLALLKPSRTA